MSQKLNPPPTDWYCRCGQVFEHWSAAQAPICGRCGQSMFTEREGAKLPLPLPLPPGTRVDAYPEHYPIAITVQIFDADDPDRWRLLVATWHYSHEKKEWERFTDDGLTRVELGRLLWFMVPFKIPLKVDVEHGPTWEELEASESKETAMHCIDDKANGIVLNYNADWSGNVCIAWYGASERRTSHDCECRGIDLIAGRFTLLAGTEPPINVITRAVALAVETYLHGKMMRATEDLFIDRGKL